MQSEQPHWLRLRLDMHTEARVEDICHVLTENLDSLSAIFPCIGF